MPTPIGHSLAGLALHLASRKRFRNRAWATGTLAVGLANLPDLDFLPGYLFANPLAYHWGPTHSMVAALMVGAVVGCVNRWYGGRFGPAVMLAFGAYASHIVLDLLLGPALAPSIGLQVFWPFSADRLMLPWSVFHMAPQSIESIGPIRALFSREILPVITRESLLLVPTVVVAWAFGRIQIGKDVSRGHGNLNDLTAALEAEESML